MFTPAMGQAIGLTVENGIAWAIARETFSVGDVGAFDIANNNAAVTNNNSGDASSGLANVVSPTAGDIVCGVLCVWLQNVTTGQRGKVLIEGETDGYLIKASGNLAAGDPLVATTAKNLSSDHSAGDRVIAICKTALTAPSTRTLGRVFFSGIRGLATLVS